MDLHSDPPPGAIEGGCTGPTYAPFGRDGDFVYLVGTDVVTGRVKSVATVSRRFGAAIFIAPAAEQILRLIAMFGDIGGFARMKAGNGDLYAVRTPVGTVILARPTTVRGDGSGFAQPYTMLLPAAATVWLQAVRSHGSWLWPMPGVRDGDRVRFQLVDDLATGTSSGSILLDPMTNRARLARGGTWGGPFGIDISEGELAAWAATAG